MPSRLLLGLLAAVLLVPSVSAQTPPSEARIRADVLAQVQPTATSVTLRGNGAREWNAGVWEFVHSITTRKPYDEMPGVEIESYGDVVYQSHGSTYQYDRYRVGDWRYFGIPDPSPDEVEAVLGTDPVSVYPGNTLDADRALAVRIEDGTYWHNPTSVTVKVGARYRTKEGPTEIADHEGVFDVRLYRDDVDGPWTGFVVMGREETELGRETRPAHEIADLRTLDLAAAIAGLEAEAAALPDVSVPDFASAEDLARFVYRVARESDAPTLEAYLRALLAPRHFVDGTDGALGVHAKAEIVDPALAAALGGRMTFREQTCEAPVLHEERTRRSNNRVYFHSALTAPPRGGGSAVAMEVAVEQAPGGYRNGQALPGRLAVGDLKIYVSDDPDDAAWIASFDDPAAMCPGPAGQAADEAQGAVEGAVEEGRRRLGRLLGRGN
ncbi:hypothetical protein [Rubrivirga sp. IMCC45206]|uniref:hypothetical protein n=1 Tax=Rubrivirga sp. IMCC45206 TaxID=3391614 RepID=UPI0039901CF9